MPRYIARCYITTLLGAPFLPAYCHGHKATPETPEKGVISVSYANADERGRLIAGLRALAAFPPRPSRRAGAALGGRVRLSAARHRRTDAGGNRPDRRSHRDGSHRRRGSRPLRGIASTSGQCNTGPSRSASTRTTATRKASDEMTLAVAILAIAVFLAGAVLGFLAAHHHRHPQRRPRPAPRRRAAHAGGSHHPPGPGRRHPEPPRRQRRRGGLTQCATARPNPSPAIARISTAANAGLASAGTGARRGIPARTRIRSLPGKK